TGNTGHSNNRKYWTFKLYRKFCTFEQQEMLNIHIIEKFQDLSTAKKSPDIRSAGNVGHSNNRK
ncbi:hypothetical protein TNIN_29791, partial [Trichonephila inaurata madagascariensis]